jgi:hypothetical protein
MIGQDYYGIDGERMTLTGLAKCRTQDFDVRR